MPINSLSGRVAVIIGGTGGIGLATGHALAEIGTSVVLTGRDADRTASAVATLTGTHGTSERISPTNPTTLTLHMRCASRSPQHEG